MALPGFGAILLGGQRRSPIQFVGAVTASGTSDHSISLASFATGDLLFLWASQLLYTPSIQTLGWTGMSLGQDGVQTAAGRRIKGPGDTVVYVDQDTPGGLTTTLNVAVLGFRNATTLDNSSTGVDGTDGTVEMPDVGNVSFPGPKVYIGAAVTLGGSTNLSSVSHPGLEDIQIILPAFGSEHRIMGYMGYMDPDAAVSPSGGVMTLSSAPDHGSTGYTLR